VELRPHALNPDFRWQARRPPFRRVSEAQARAYDDDGGFVLENAFDAATLALLLEEIDPAEQRAEAFPRTQPGGRAFIARADAITFAPHLVVRSPRLRALCASPLFQDLAHDLIGPDVRLYWDQAVYKKPGAREPFPWHQDNGYTFIEPQQYLTCWIALSDATEDNGCPWVVPGLHRGGTLAHEPSELGFVCFDTPPRPPVAVPARAGQVVVFSSLTPHATGPNHSAGTRKAYIVQFAPDGAQIVREDASGARVCTPANAPERQFPVLVAGEAPR
jgi:ectoine hydroxylase-related dioxygenase (phytanoyl-CoA dioxygenase family)